MTILDVKQDAVQSAVGWVDDWHLEMTHCVAVGVFFLPSSMTASSSSAVSGPLTTSGVEWPDKKPKY